MDHEETQYNAKGVLCDIGAMQAEFANLADKEKGNLMSDKIRRIKEYVVKSVKDKDELKRKLQEAEAKKPQIPSSSESLSKDEEAKTKVQILDSIQTKASVKFATALETRLGDFECLVLADPDILNNDIPLIVVCPHSTRLKPDIELALKQVNYTPRLLVLIVHTGIESNLPAISSSKKLGVYKNNVEFIDMGFDVDYGGIYECELNVSAMSNLEEYIKKFG